MSTSKKERPRIKWFSRLLPIDPRNAGLTISQKKAKAEKDCRAVLATQSRAKYEIPRNGFKWESPKRGESRHRLTVWILLKRGHDPGPGNPPVPATKAPPPSM